MLMNINRKFNITYIHTTNYYGERTAYPYPSVIKPKYVRVNTLKISLEDAVASFKEEGWEELKCPNSYDEYLQLIQQRMFKKEYFFVRDFHVSNMLVFPNGVEFFNHPAYKEGFIILQDKGSCLSTCCIPIKPGSVILDMCAAPGMKTSLYASSINNNGKIYALELDYRRFREMEKLLYTYNVNCVTSKNCDAGSVGPETCSNVKYIILDPSCSGSGMTSRIEDEEKVHLRDKFQLQKLSNLQGYLLRHAISNFPTAKYIVYSTCSLQEEENEVVVESVLSCANFHGYSLINMKKKLNGWKNFGSNKYECGKKCLYSRPDFDYTNGGFLAIFKRKFKNDLSTCQIKMENVKHNNTSIESKKIKLSEQFFAVVNTLKISVEEAIQCFVDNDWKHLPAPMDYDIFLTCLQDSTKRKEERFFEQDFHVEELLLFPRGIVDELSKTFVKEQKFILMDKVSCLAVHLLDPLPKSKVLDMCAGYEKLSLFISLRMKDEGCIYSYEQHTQLYKLLKKELISCGISCVNANLESGLYSSATKCPGVQLILISPPCSETGLGDKDKSDNSVMRQSDNMSKGLMLRKYIVTQFSLLRRALTEFPDAHRIVYMTRSIYPEENEEIINALLVMAKFHGFKLIDAPSRIKGWSNDCNTKYFCGTKCLISRDYSSITKGFFIAVFERNVKNVSEKSVHVANRISSSKEQTNYSTEDVLQENVFNISEQKTVENEENVAKMKKKSQKKYDTSKIGIDDNSKLGNEVSSVNNTEGNVTDRTTVQRTELPQTKQQDCVNEIERLDHKKKPKHKNDSSQTTIENCEESTSLNFIKVKSKKSKSHTGIGIETAVESMVDKEGGAFESNTTSKKKKRKNKTPGTELPQTKEEPSEEAIETFNKKRKNKNKSSVQRVDEADQSMLENNDEPTTLHFVKDKSKKGKKHAVVDIAMAVDNNADKKEDSFESNTATKKKKRKHENKKSKVFEESTEISKYKKKKKNEVNSQSLIEASQNTLECSEEFTCTLILKNKSNKRKKQIDTSEGNVSLEFSASQEAFKDQAVLESEKDMFHHHKRKEKKNKNKYL